MRIAVLSKFRNIKKNIYKEGWFWTINHYWQSIKILIFSYILFGRNDIKVFPDSQITGIECMKIGTGFIAGRGLWLEAIKEYPATGQFFSPKIIIGKRVSLGEYVHIGCNNLVIIGDDVLMGSKIYITDHNHGTYRGEFSVNPVIPPIVRPLTEKENVIIGNRCWIGEYVTILPGVSIGDGCIVGSHSTVTHDIPANSIAVGSPAHVVKTWDEETKKWKK